MHPKKKEQKSMSDNNQKIRERAHRIWGEQGRPEGRHAEHWAHAESELQEGLDAESATEGSRSDEAEATAQDAAGELNEGEDAEAAAQQLGAGAETAAPQAGGQGRDGKR
jgi:hypothetical protein